MTTKRIWRAASVGAGLGAWLGLLSGLVPALLLPGAPWLPMSLGGLLIGAVAGAALGFVTHWATGERRAPVAPRPSEHLEVHRTVLPRLGRVYSFVTADGRRVGVVAHVDGRRDLISYDPEEPERVEHAAALTEREAGAVALMLGAPVLVDR